MTTPSTARSTWSRVLREIDAEIQQFRAQRSQPQPGGPGPVDIVRRRKIAAVVVITGRPLVVYATACTIPTKVVPQQMLMLDFSDKLAFRDITERIEPPHLDVLVHSPGGSAEAVESIVEQLRAHFNHVRFIVPNFAKSAATMLVLSGNEILLDPDAELGPIDPQMHTPFGLASADAILRQYRTARREILSNPNRVSIWGPLLSSLGPALLIQCSNAIRLSRSMVVDWLSKYMFAGDRDGPQKARKVAQFLGQHGAFMSHARKVKMSDLAPYGLNIVDISQQQRLANAIQELYCAIDLTLSNTPAVRIIENGLGDTIIRNFGGQGGIQIQLGPGPRPPSPPIPPL